MASTEELLSERQTTHGSFPENAMVSQAIKRLFRNCPNYQGLNDIQKEGLDRISLKLGRILGGNPNVKDHWDDIAGYATLVSQEIK